MSQSQQQPQFSGSESPRVRRTQQQNTKGLLFCLQADGDNAAQALIQRQLAEPPDLIFLFQRHQRVIPQIAETHQTAQARYQRNQIVVQSFFLRDAAELIL